jgi:3-keto-5-aminohexanoate cleavage enzyme
MYRLKIKPEMEVFDLSMISNAVALADRSLAVRPLHFNFVMGLKGAMPAKIEHSTKGLLKGSPVSARSWEGK